MFEEEEKKGNIRNKKSICFFSVFMVGLWFKIDWVRFYWVFIGGRFLIVLVNSGKYGCFVVWGYCIEDLVYFIVVRKIKEIMRLELV